MLTGTLVHVAGITSASRLSIPSSSLTADLWQPLPAQQVPEEVAELTSARPSQRPAGAPASGLPGCLR